MEGRTYSVAYQSLAGTSVAACDKVIARVRRSPVMRRFALLLLFAASSVFAANSSREELIKSPKFAEAKAPRFVSLTPESLRDAVKVSSRRNYAVAGFNDPSVTVWLPMSTNSIYSSFEFDKPRVTDARGREVAFEIEQGIFDFETSANEIRFTKKGGTIDFAHAVGKVTVKYPLVVKTISYKKGTSGDVTIHGPFVSYNSSAVVFPEEATFTKIRSLRAYDAQGRQLERSGSRGSTVKGDVSWPPPPFWAKARPLHIQPVHNAPPPPHASTPPPPPHPPP